MRILDEESNSELEPAEPLPQAPPSELDTALPAPDPVEGQPSADLESQLVENQRQLMRLAADFDNFRRRAASEKDELVRFAASRVLENFLPIVDNFERALAHASSDDTGSFRQGVEMIYRQVVDFLGRQGVVAMEVVGQPFDPTVHEAIGQVETTERADGEIAVEVQRGYFLNGRVLRHALVQVASNPDSRAVSQVTEDLAQADNPTTLHDYTDFLGADDPAAVASKMANDEDFTLEELMAQAQGTEGTKEESNG